MRTMGRVLILGLCLWPAASNAETYLAKYRSVDRAVSAVQEAGGTVVRRLERIRVLVVESPVPDFGVALQASGAVSAVIRNRRISPIPARRSIRRMNAVSRAATSGSPLDAALLGSQWNLAITKTDQAWGMTLGDPNVTVAILDTGYCAHHVDTIGRVDEATSVSFVEETEPGCAAAAAACPTCPPWEDYDGHGTFVASIVSSNNVLTAGAAPGVKLQVIKVAGCGDVGSILSVLEGFDYALGSGAKIVSISLALTLPNEDFLRELTIGDPFISDVLREARRQGVFVVTAAGNDSLDLDQREFFVLPCQLGRGVFCVGATTSSDELAPYSNHGLRGPQIMAPGGDPSDEIVGEIVGPCAPHIAALNSGFPAGCDDTDVVFDWGTSHAAPLVAAAAALAQSVAPGGPGTLKPSQLRRSLRSGADELGLPGPDNLHSRGRLNTLRTVSRIVQ